MKLKKKVDPSVDTFPSLELGTKHPWKELQRQSLQLRLNTARDQKMPLVKFQPNYQLEHLLDICPGEVLWDPLVVLCPIF